MRIANVFVAEAGALLLAAGTALAAHPDPVHIDVESPLGDIVLDGTLFQPECTVGGVTKAPVILQSHGWGGSKKSSIDDEARAYLDACMGMFSFSQRGHGNTGGQRNVHDPNYEGQDMKPIIDLLAKQDWVAKDRDGEGNEIANDPVLGAVGGSYGGGFQWLLALTEIRDSSTFDENGLVAQGKTRLNALAPDISWHNLSEALAPEDVVRSVWVLLLGGTGFTTMAPPYQQSIVTGLALGSLPDGSVPATFDTKGELRKHGPRGFVDLGLELPIPVFLTQGMTDNLFNLNQGWKNFELTLSDSARAKSIFVGHNGGHHLPNVLPLGAGAAGGEVCTPEPPAGVARTTNARIEFFQAVFPGGSGDPRSDLGMAAYNLTTSDGNCVRRASLEPTMDLPVLEPVHVALTPTGAGLPIQIPLASGPLTVAGIPMIAGKLTTLGIDARAFFALSVGTNPLDAAVVQDNVMPIRSQLPVVQQAIEKELPGVAVEVGEGEQLFLTVSPVSDMFVGFQSRTPGALVIEEAVVKVPVVAP